MLDIHIGKVGEDDRFNLGKAVTPEEFLEFIKGKNIDDLVSKVDTKSFGPFQFELKHFLRNGPGSEYRYVYDPARPGKVIDIEHLLAAASIGGLGEELGFLNELDQASEYPHSAGREEDFRSNRQGERFGTRYLGQHGSLEADFREYFEDRAREETPLREQPTLLQTPRLEVEATQELLENLDYLEENQINGRFNAETAIALRKFQGDRSLPETGDLDFQTWRALAAEGGIDEFKEYAIAAKEFGEEHGRLTFRDTGNKVEVIQGELAKLGYLSGENINGRFDRTTVEATRKFQEENGLPVNGTIDFRTYRALTETAPEQVQETRPVEQSQINQPEAYPTLRLEDSGPAVEELQTRLKNLSYEVGEIDGQYGSKTAAAVREFQSNNNLSPDGVAGPQTWQALHEATSERLQPATRDLNAPSTEAPSQKDAADSLPRRLWRNFTGALGLAGEIGKDEVSFALPSSGREIFIRGETTTQTVWGTVGQDLFATLQVRDGELLADISQREVAEEAVRHVGNALQVAESISQESQEALEA